MSDTVETVDPDRQSEALKLVTEALRGGTEEQKAALRTALGVGGVIQKRPRQKLQTNSQAKNAMLAQGEIVHPPLADGSPWSPGPSEGMVANMEKHVKAVSARLGKEVTAKELAYAVLRKKHLNAEFGSGASSTLTAREAEEKFGLNSVDPDDLAAIATENFPTDVAAADFSEIGFEAEEGSG